MASETRNLFLLISSARRVGLALLVGLCSFLGGCVAPLDFFAFKTDDDDDEETAERLEDEESRDRILGDSALHRKSRLHRLPKEDREEFEKADQLYNEERYAAAEKAFQSIASRYKRSSNTSWNPFQALDNKDDEEYKWTENSKYENRQIVEDALFMLAESQYQQKRYAKALDSYNLLVKEFPSTRYLAGYTKRLFAISRYWLDFPEDITAGDVQLAQFNEDGSKGSLTVNQQPKTGSWDPSRSIPIFPNVWDRTRPAFDTESQALEALRQIWLNDPNGSLADDALMMTASYYLRKENYSEADHYYGLLRDQYPKSTHLENAYVLGSHVKLMSYQGPAYDAQPLIQSQELKEKLLRMSPDHPDRERMQDELRAMKEAEAGPDWEVLHWCYRKREAKAMEIYCKEIIRKYPQTNYASRARKVLAELEAGNMVNPNSIHVRGSSGQVESEIEKRPSGLIRIPFVKLRPLPLLGRGTAEESDSDDLPSEETPKPTSSTPGRVKL